ncbi:hypothetical protein ACFW1A_05180, partial [Kitasatospora sp. NPDC058965]
MKSDHQQPDHQHPDREQSQRRPDGPSDGHRPDGPDGTLAMVCRSVAQLAKAAPTPPRRIRLQSGQTTVEVEWPEPAPGAAAAPGAAPA